MAERKEGLSDKLEEKETCSENKTDREKTNYDSYTADSRGRGSHYRHYYPRHYHRQWRPQSDWGVRDKHRRKRDEKSKDVGSKDSHRESKVESGDRGTMVEELEDKKEEHVRCGNGDIGNGENRVSRDRRNRKHGGNQKHRASTCKRDEQKPEDTLQRVPQAVESRKRSPSKVVHLRVNKKVTSSTQSEDLSQQLLSGVYECVVCCDSVQYYQEVWSCKCCYHIFHLRCIRRWAHSSTAAANEGEFVTVKF